MSDEELVVREDTLQGADSYVKALERLHALRGYQGDPKQFWDALLRVLATVADAQSGVIIVRGDGPDRSWRLLAIAPQNLRGGTYAESMVRKVEEATPQFEREKVILWKDQGDRLAAVALETGESGRTCIAAFVLEATGAVSAKEVVRRLRMTSDVPAIYQARRLADESKFTVERIAGVLDLLVMLNEKKRFMPAAMTFCNEISARLHCERVSLGWLHRGYIRLQATSHVDRFDRKSDAVRMLEAAMEESVDQNSEVAWPEERGGAVTRDHKNFASAHDAGFVYSLPVRIDQEPEGVCTCERTSRSFSEAEAGLLRLFVDQAGRRLGDLKRWDRWFGARIAMRAREGIGRLIGFKHTWLKVIALLITALVAFLLFARVPYHVTASLTLKTDDISTLTAPFAGHIQKVNVRVGDQVTKGEQLLALDKTDLLLSEAQVVAQMQSYQSQADKARATGSLADMRIALAQEDQARAQYNLVRYHLSQSVISAPFAGVVVEGDLLGHIGLPVTEGETLFKIARIDRLYAVLDVSEQDIRWVSQKSTGEMALASHPGQVTPIKVTRIEPEAVTKNKGNVFHVDCSFPNGPLSFWRPGMTGVAKINVGSRSPLWIVTHRTADFLRLHLWW